MTTPDAPWEPRASYVELHALACSMREDWNPDDLKDAMTAVIHGSWSWKDIYREVMRLAWTEGETPRTLRNSARRPAAGTPAPLDPELKATLLADLKSRTGPQQRLTPENDWRHTA